MQRQNIIVLIQMCDFRTKSYGNLKKACGVYGWNYSTMSKKKLPQKKDGWLIQRVPFN